MKKHKEHSSSFAKATLAAGSVTVVASLPGFLTGALGVQMSQQLGFSATRLGLTIALWRMSSVISASRLGRVADRLGGRSALKWAALTTAISCTGIAFFATSWLTLTGWLVVAGLAHALGAPAANRLLANLVPAGRQGLAFGVKQAAPALSSMLAGLSVPIIAVRFGWQSAFGLAALLSLSSIAFAGRRRTSARISASPETNSLRADRKTRWALFIAISLATISSSTIVTFFVSAGVDSGMSEGSAGTALAVASVSTIVVRVALGAYVDRRQMAYLRICAVLLAIGAVGSALLTTLNPTAMVIGAVVALAGAWGFPGVFWFAVVRAFSERPGATTGALTPGALLGAMLGPLLGGIFADRLGYSATWWFATSAAVVSALAMLFASRRLTQLGPRAN